MRRWVAATRLRSLEKIPRLAERERLATRAAKALVSLLVVVAGWGRFFDLIEKLAGESPTRLRGLEV